MKVTLTKEDQDHRTETISTCEAEAFISKIKSETKGKYINGLRTILEYTSGNSGGHYEHIDRPPHICPALEYGRAHEGKQRVKRCNSIVLLEVRNLSGLSEVEPVKEQVSLLPQTYATFVGSSIQEMYRYASFIGTNNFSINTKKRGTESKRTNKGIQYHIVRSSIFSKKQVTANYCRHLPTHLPTQTNNHLYLVHLSGKYLPLQRILFSMSVFVY